MASTQTIDHHIHIGTASGYHGSTTPFSLHVPDLFQHVYMNGQTGTGKSTLHKIFFSELVNRGYGCTFFDFNGDAATEVTDLIPPHRVKDVVNFDLSDTDYAIPINFFYDVPPLRRAIFAEQFNDSLKHVFEDGWGHRMDDLLRNLVHALCDAPQGLRPTLLSIPVALVDKDYCRKVFRSTNDPVLRDYYEKDLSKLTPRQHEEYSSPIKNKIRPLITNPYLRHTMGSYKSSFHFPDAIAQNSIVILRLPKGLIARGARFFGSIALANFINQGFNQQIHEATNRCPHFLILDEIHNAATGCLVDPLSEGRKYSLSLLISTQYTEQLPRNVLAAILGNAGTVFGFRSSPHDAAVMAETIGDPWPASHYIDKPLAEANVRYIRHRSPQPSVRIQLNPETIVAHNQGAWLRQMSAQRYAKPVSEIHAAYVAWYKNADDGAERRHKRSQKQRETTVKRVERATRKPTGHTLTEKEKQERFKQISDMLSASGHSDARWPTLKQPHKANRRAKRKRTFH